MACTPGLAIPTPPDISPLTLAPPSLPPISGDLNVCCKILSFSWTPVIPIPAEVLNSAVMGAIVAQVAIANAWLDGLGYRCARE